MPNPTLADFVCFNDEKLAQRFGAKPIPMSTLYEAYFDGAIDLKPGVTIADLLAKRQLFVKYSLTQDHLKWAVKNFVPEVSLHSRASDQRLVREHYDRGNEFFESFLGPRMAYTCAHFTDPGDSLEAAQDAKLARVALRLELRPEHRLLDIGAGFGALVTYVAREHQVKAIGISLAQNEAQLANERIAAWGLGERAQVRCADYRDLEGERYDRITCLEMIEHVGVKNLSSFLQRVRELLTDDGLFLLQWTGLRRGLQPEDLIWGLFMNRYVFPGADASLPPGSMLKATEKAGFECQLMENLSPHYALTISAWARNWERQRELIVARFGERWFRIWSFFLAWSSLVAKQGSAACFQVVLNKNEASFDRMARLSQRAPWAEQPARPHEPAHAAAAE
ncbi:MAG: class I SAM-dependent methyltransferase [Polyangiaceae bacterium]|nr:class I SAM-dependent methyltransferase [Polyangiaceae bacterium]